MTKYLAEMKVKAVIISKKLIEIFVEGVSHLDAEIEVYVSREDNEKIILLNQKSRNIW